MINVHLSLLKEILVMSHAAVRTWTLIVRRFMGLG